MIDGRDTASLKKEATADKVPAGALVVEIQKDQVRWGPFPSPTPPVDLMKWLCESSTTNNELIDISGDHPSSVAVGDSGVLHHRGGELQGSSDSVSPHTNAASIGKDGVCDDGFKDDINRGSDPVHGQQLGAGLVSVAGAGRGAGLTPAGAAPLGAQQGLSGRLSRGSRDAATLGATGEGGLVRPVVSRGRGRGSSVGTAHACPRCVWELNPGRRGRGRPPKHSCGR